MATAYDAYLPVATKIIQGFAAKPGVKFADKRMAADWMAQVLHGMVQRGEIPPADNRCLHEISYGTGRRLPQRCVLPKGHDGEHQWGAK